MKLQRCIAAACVTQASLSRRWVGCAGVLLQQQQQQQGAGCTPPWRRYASNKSGVVAATRKRGRRRSEPPVDDADNPWAFGGESSGGGILGEASSLFRKQFVKHVHKEDGMEGTEQDASKAQHTGPHPELVDALVGTPKHENVHTERRRTKADWKKVREEANAAKVAAHQERLDRAISAQSRRLQQHLADLKSSRGSIEDMLQVARACSEAEAAGAGGASISNPAPWLHNAAHPGAPPLGSGERASGLGVRSAAQLLRLITRAAERKPRMVRQRVLKDTAVQWLLSVLKARLVDASHEVPITTVASVASSLVSSGLRDQGLLHTIASCAQQQVQSMDAACIAIILNAFNTLSWPTYLFLDLVPRVQHLAPTMNTHQLQLILHAYANAATKSFLASQSLVCLPKAQQEDGFTIEEPDGVDNETRERRHELSLEAQGLAATLLRGGVGQPSGRLSEVEVARAVVWPVFDACAERAVSLCSNPSMRASALAGIAYSFAKGASDATSQRVQRALQPRIMQELGSMRAPEVVRCVWAASRSGVLSDALVSSSMHLLLGPARSGSSSDQASGTLAHASRVLGLGGLHIADMASLLVALSEASTSKLASDEATVTHAVQALLRELRLRSRGAIMHDFVGVAKFVGALTRANWHDLPGVAEPLRHVLASVAVRGPNIPPPPPAYLIKLAWAVGSAGVPAPPEFLLNLADAAHAEMRRGTMTRAQAAVFVYSLAAARVYHPGVYHTALSVPTAHLGIRFKRQLYQAHLSARLRLFDHDVGAEELAAMQDENLYRGQRALQQLESVWCSKMEPLTAGVAGQLQQLADAEGWHKLLPSLSADAARDCRVVRDFIVGNVGYVMPLAVPQLFLGVDIIDAAVQQRGDRTLQRRPATQLLRDAQLEALGWRLVHVSQHDLAEAGAQAVVGMEAAGADEAAVAEAQAAARAAFIWSTATAATAATATAGGGGEGEGTGSAGAEYTQQCVVGILPAADNVFGVGKK